MRKSSPTITEDIAAIIKRALQSRKLHQHQIAAKLGVNQGRISEIKSGAKWANVKPASELPPWFLETK